MDMVDTPKKEIRDMNVMELIEKISETTKIAALNLWGTFGERTENVRTSPPTNAHKK